MWIIYTLLAVFAQIIRNIFSKNLSTELSSETVSLARFLYGIPVVAIGLIIAAYTTRLPQVTSYQFFVYIAGFGMFQILANTLLVSLFKEKNFAISLSFIKSEAIFIAIIAFSFLGEVPSIIAGTGITLAFIGLMVSSLAKEKISISKLVTAFSTKGAYIGLSSGLFFALAVVCIKKSFLFVLAPSISTLSLFSLLIALIFQVSILSIYVIWKKREEFFILFSQPKTPLLIGTFSGIGSLFWLMAFASSYIAYVKTLGQIEFVLGVLVSIFYFKEKISKNEYIGMSLMVVGMILVQF